MAAESAKKATTAQNRAKTSSVEGKPLTVKDLWPAQEPLTLVLDRPAWQIAPAVLSRAMR
jgi:hypothetical protein